MTLALSNEQTAAVKAACAMLRPNSRDRFLQNLASELAHYRPPVSDAAVRICIERLLGIMPVTHFISEDID